MNDYGDSGAEELDFFGLGDLRKGPLGFEDAGAVFEAGHVGASHTVEAEEAPFLDAFAALSLDPKEPLKKERQQEELPALELPHVAVDDFNWLDDGQDSDNSRATTYSVPESDEAKPNESQQLDIWNLASQIPEQPARGRLVTWDSYLASKPSAEVQSPFLTENPAEVFDAVLHRALNNIYDPHAAGTPIESTQFFRSLAELGLGRESVLWKWNADTRYWEDCEERVRVTGCTVESVAGITEMPKACGANFRMLEGACVEIKGNPEEFGATAVAFGECVTVLLDDFRRRLTSEIRDIPTNRGLLMLEAIFKPVHAILEMLAEIAFVNEKHEIRIGIELLKKVFEMAQANEWLEGSVLRPVLYGVLQRTSVPYLERLEKWMHMGRERSRGALSDMKEFFIQKTPTSANAEGDGYTLKQSHIPPFLSHTDALRTLGSGESLELIKTCKPDHPLCQYGEGGAMEGMTKLKLEWKFMWEDLERLGEGVRRYEREMRDVLEAYRNKNTVTPSSDGNVEMEVEVEDKEVGRDEMDMDMWQMDKEQLQTIIGDLREMMSAPPTTTTTTTPQPTDAATSLNITVSNPPSLDTIAHHAFQRVLAMQSRLIQTATLDLFLHDLNLRHELELWWRFGLFGDGRFVGTLREGVFGANGLGLGNGGKGRWPPSGGRLVGALDGVWLGGKENNRISFGVVEPEPTDNDENGDMVVAKWSDPDSLHALDWLRVHWRGEYPLNTTVFRGEVVERYASMWRFLLVLVRLDRTVRNFPRATMATKIGIGGEEVRFRVEVAHFVAGIVGFVFDVAVGATWKAFMDELSGIERKVKKGNVEGLSLAGLMAAHDAMLDKMLSLSLQGKRQAPILKLVEGMFGVILEYNKLVRERGENEREGKEEVKGLVERFGRYMGMFLRVLRRLEEKGSEGLQELQARMDFGGYYRDGVELPLP
ncbi:hypothetical protein SAICODRAFT_16684 [Saitoella complicata NRRL Y-17804]|uniref:Spindle pole body component n=1 Tax=Saitoella complicata (strain BCRC 22490 / CBS 7301 / JCM 7358 / NBRC 10748 / NRRL Y-17804) TaxID=698492 RepID=A0A0E9N8L6_SAICN|nr:uncharacterized protein SAICODRAFT_16684 [Saitoella complicata NRRL Y-17804]ODQ55626.1 hypothetical protein SAICODRAFT_16684 [Saitoella complicata NRRL Y-17804]GAO46041.1 hypothetical protein G7K_0286-t1 [Saitoella complicata NRRL Y-17804]